LELIQKKPEPVPGNKKGHTLIGYGLECLAPRAGRSAKLFLLSIWFSAESGQEKPSSNGISDGEDEFFRSCILKKHNKYVMR
jgi:hypothetical protein